MNKIQEFRLKKGINQAAFARLIGINRTYLYRLEKGQAKPGNKVLDSIKEKFPETDLNIFFKN